MRTLLIFLVLSLSPGTLYQAYTDARSSRGLQDPVSPERPLGSVRGTVKSVDSDPLPGATIRIEVTGRVWEAQSNTNGEYMITNLNPGDHQVKVTLPGYSNKKMRAKVREFQSTTLDFVLRKKR